MSQDTVDIDFCLLVSRSDCRLRTLLEKRGSDDVDAVQSLLLMREK